MTLTSRSNRNTGTNRSYRGSGCVGIIPSTKPGNPHKLRRKTKPLRLSPGHRVRIDEQVIRGRRAQTSLVEKRWLVRRNLLARAVSWALGHDQ